MSTDKCDFIITEINHDLNSARAKPKITNELLKTPNFRMIASLNLDSVCKDKNIPNFFNDEKIVEQIMGISKKDLQMMPDGNNSIRVKTKENRPTDIIQTTKLNRSRSLTTDYINLFEQDHVFLVIDTDNAHIVQNLIKYFNAQPTGPFPQIHIIHSVLTLADSAPKTKPDDGNYINKTGRQQQIDVNSWYYTQEIDIPTEDPLFMSRYTVKNKLVTGSNWDVQQQWILPETQQLQQNKQDFFSLNAKKDNNVPAVTERIGKNNFDSPRITEPNKKEVNLCIQRKRSGDYLQIWMADNLPRILSANNFDISHMLHVRPTGKVRIFPAGNTRQWYKDRTYFVTGDYPAFCYAVYNKINCYFNPPIPNGYILRTQSM